MGEAAHRLLAEQGCTVTRLDSRTSEEVSPWIARQGDAAVGKSEITPHVAGCDDQCTFGKWLYSDQITLATRAGLPYQVVRRLHAEFHQSAGAVLQQAVNGNRGEAEALMLADFTPRSEKPVRALTKWKREVAAAA